MTPEPLKNKGVKGFTTEDEYTGECNICQMEDYWYREDEIKSAVEWFRMDMEQILTPYVFKILSEKLDKAFEDVIKQKSNKEIK